MLSLSHIYIYICNLLLGDQSTDVDCWIFDIPGFILGFIPWIPESIPWIDVDVGFFSS